MSASDALAFSPRSRRASSSAGSGADSADLLRFGVNKVGDKNQSPTEAPASTRPGKKAPRISITIAASANRTAGQRRTNSARWAPLTLNNKSAQKIPAITRSASSMAWRRPLVSFQNFNGSPSSPGSFSVTNRSRNSWRAATWLIRISPCRPSPSRSKSVRPFGNSSL